jgi:hypothetical protein
MANALSKKSGKGLSDGVTSELATYWDILPGHEEELRAATQRFAGMLRAMDPAKLAATGLRDSRHVIFDDGRRLLWATTFETEWDPYVDEALLLVGIGHFLDWTQHTIQGGEIAAWAKSFGVENLNPDDPKYEETVRKTTGQLKAILQSVQAPAAGYFSALSAWTTPQLIKAQHVEEAFEQALLAWATPDVAHYSGP